MPLPWPRRRWSAYALVNLARAPFISLYLLCATDSGDGQCIPSDEGLPKVGALLMRIHSSFQGAGQPPQATAAAACLARPPLPWRLWVRRLGRLLHLAVGSRVSAAGGITSSSVRLLGVELWMGHGACT